MAKLIAFFLLCIIAYMIYIAGGTYSSADKFADEKHIKMLTDSLKKEKEKYAVQK